MPLKTFLVKATGGSAISLLSVQNSAPYVATGLIYFFLLCVLIDSVVEEEVHNMDYFHLQFIANLIFLALRHATSSMACLAVTYRSYLSRKWHDICKTVI